MSVMRGSRQTKHCLPRRPACKLLIAVINAAAAAPSELSAPVKERVCHPQTHLVPRLTGQFVGCSGGGGGVGRSRRSRKMLPLHANDATARDVVFGKGGFSEGGVGASRPIEKMPA